MARLYTISSRKSQQEIDPLVRHIDEWERVSADQKDEVLGDGYFDEIEDFYNLSDVNDSVPSFRPDVKIPELQVLMLNEANDLSELSPRVFIVNGKSGKREEDREKAFQSAWRQALVNYHLMFAQVWGLFGGTGWLQGGYDPDARNGRGEFWAKMRNPKTVFTDPAADYELKWSYLIVKDWLYLEEIRRRWPIASVGLKQRYAGQSRPPAIGIGSDTGYGMTMPPGPMETMGGTNAAPVSRRDNRLCVRTVYCLDYTRELVEDKEIPPGALTTPDVMWKYPNGRLLVECEGRILQDGDNPYPMQKFPLVPIWGTPPIGTDSGVWAVPPTKFSRGLQDLSGRMYTNLYENAVRLNNGIWFIPEGCGLSAEDFGGLPGEVRVINMQSQALPQQMFPKEMPSHMIQLPAMLLQKQRELQGFTPARQGDPGAGNVSSDLYDSSVLRSQGLTQLRGRLLGVSVQRFAELMFYTMARYYRSQSMPYRGGPNFEMVNWDLVQRPDQYDVYLDEASIRPMSEAMLRRMIPELRKQGILSTRRALEMLDVPDAEGIADDLQREQELAALGKVKGNRR